MKTVIEMAREAGFERVVEDCPRTGIKTVEFYAPDSLERFAELVRADERKKWEEQKAVEIHEAILEEREACAEFIEDGYVRQFEWPWRQDLAAAIRARSIR